MFIRNAWYVAAWADEIVQRPLARRICNDPVVLYRGMDGRVAALDQADRPRQGTNVAGAEAVA